MWDSFECSDQVDQTLGQIHLAERRGLSNKRDLPCRFLRAHADPPPYNVGKALAASQARTSHTRALIHMRIVEKNTSMGLLPPSVVGNNT